MVVMPDFSAWARPLPSPCIMLLTLATPGWLLFHDARLLICCVVSSV